MTENESILEKESMDNQLDCDRLSDLRMHIIHIILGSVPIRDAIRTCVLSKKWRYTWISLPKLVFHHKSCATKLDIKSEKHMINFITQALFRHEGSIYKFKLFITSSKIYPEIEGWVHCFARNDIRKLTISVGRRFPEHGDDMLQLHSSIYSCKKLTYLELSSCNMDPPPSTFKGFLFLRCLIIEALYWSYDKLESLVASCPLLAILKLKFKRQFFFEKLVLRINAPNLKYLDLDGCYTKICLNAPLLAEVSVNFFYECGFFDVIMERSAVCNYSKFFGGITNLEKLKGGSNFTHFMRYGIKSCHPSLVFNHLKVIELDSVCLEDIKESMVVVRLVIDAPNLQHLKLKTWNLNDESEDDESEDGESEEGESEDGESDSDDGESEDGESEVDESEDDESEAWDESLRDIGCTSNFRHEKLTSVEVKGLGGCFAEQKLIKFLLKSSPMLKTMNVDYQKTLGAKKTQILTNELLGFIQPNISFSIDKSRLRLQF